MDSTKPDNLDAAMPVFVTDAEIIRRLGLGRDAGRRTLHMLARLKEFPQKDPLFGNRRFWPSVVQFLNRRHGVRE